MPAIKLKVGQKIWFERERGDYGHHAVSGFLTVSSIGRLWAKVKDNKHQVIEIGTGRVYNTARDYFYGHIWETKAACDAARELEKQWRLFSITIAGAGNRVPKGMTLDHILRARQALGMETDPANMEREIFKEVRETPTGGVVLPEFTSGPTAEELSKKATALADRNKRRKR